MQTNHIANTKTNNNTKNSNTKPSNQHQNANKDEDDDWVTAKAKPIEETAQERMAKKSATQRKNHGFNSYMAPTSLKDMRDQIIQKKIKRRSSTTSTISWYERQS